MSDSAQDDFAPASETDPLIAEPEENVTQYSIHGRSQKRLIVFIVAFAAMFSPLSSFIYYPALKAVAEDLHISLTKMDFTITSYMIVSGFMPSILGEIADMAGRRPVYLFMLTVYVAANVGLALQNSYLLLLLLRMLQSAGSSGVSARVVLNSLDLLV